jgi:hypothetical protein
MNWRLTLSDPSILFTHVLRGRNTSQLARVVQEPDASSQWRLGRRWFGADVCTTRPANPRGVEMKTTLAIATIAILCTAGHPTATTIDRPLARSAPAVATALAAGQNTAFPWSGRWQGTTVSGQELMLQLQIQGQRITGRLTVGKQSANIIYGKVVGQAFALTTGPIDGHGVDATGRHVGDAIELTIEGVKKPLTLTRMK